MRNQPSTPAAHTRIRAVVFSRRLRTVEFSAVGNAMGECVVVLDDAMRGVAGER